MKSFYQLVKERRSCRIFLDTPVEDDKILQILNAALMSPSSKQSTPWQFIVVRDSEKLRQLSRSKTHGSLLLENAPLAIVVLSDPAISDVWIEDSSIASLYIQLMAEDLGLGSCWVQIRNRYHDNKKLSSEYIKSLLAIPEDFEILSIIAIGYKSKERAPYVESDLNTAKVHAEIFGLPYFTQLDENQE